MGFSSLGRVSPAFAKGIVTRTIFINKRLPREISKYLAALSTLPTPASPLRLTQNERRFSPIRCARYVGRCINTQALMAHPSEAMSGIFSVSGQSPVGGRQGFPCGVQHVRRRFRGKTERWILMIFSMPERVSGGDVKFQGF